MFGKLFRKKPKEPVFVNLDFYANKDKYFVRLQPWDWFTDVSIYTIGLVDKKPTMLTMDPWTQEVYLNADGQSTVSEYVNRKAQEYVNSRSIVPVKLGQTIVEELENLVHKYGAIELKDDKTILPLKLAFPISEQKDLN
ncbi:hypothetical protein [Pedobacter metabolipauper]|uniref:Uncharacterized protein n=1 Tax=Pedobacter metabolipauper TaxID=425513 RepID=A0A4R6T2X4_9SPHI|nr:hypothetical protein [Pedobacter metabolipauper]TDQ11721.1 hypothetical protein ATK78_0849 [Pedobacter metabolipauper]